MLESDINRKKGKSWIGCIVNSRALEFLVNVASVYSGVIAGLKTYNETFQYLVEEPYGFLFYFADDVVIAIFVCEIMLKIGKLRCRPWLYFFSEDWAGNCFDFIVTIASIPSVLSVSNRRRWTFSYGGNITFLRFLRQISFLKLTRRGRVVEGGLVSGLRSLASIVLIFLVVLFIFGVIGVAFFSRNDPGHFATLPWSMFTLFSIATLDKWSDILYVVT